ncbi:MAG: viroplasmin family protein [Butyribacter sp.]
MAGKFYAVKEGRSTGVFASWAECKKQVDGYSGAKYKKFYKYAGCDGIFE